MGGNRSEVATNRGRDRLSVIRYDTLNVRYKEQGRREGALQPKRPFRNCSLLALC